MNYLPIPYKQAVALLAEGRAVYVGYRRGLLVRNRTPVLTVAELDAALRPGRGRGAPQCYVEAEVL